MTVPAAERFMISDARAAVIAAARSHRPYTVEAMSDFFDGRTLGCEARLDDRNPWFWRGHGYDDGWAEVTDDELRELHRLLDAYFDGQVPSSEGS